MKRLFNQRIGCIFVLLIVVAGSVSLIYQWVSNPAIIAQQISNMSAPTATLPPSLALSTASSNTQPCKGKQRNFEMGVSFPQWSSEGYGGNDDEWLLGLPEMHKQTGACWVEMPLLLYQDSVSATSVGPGNSTPLLPAFLYGIQLAHREGLHVFVTAILGVGGPNNPWAGEVQFSTADQVQQWFRGYWQGLKPYLQIAAQTGVEQFAIGTEENWLQENAPDDLWNTLIANAHSIYSGTLTYDMNWSTLPQPPRNWMHNPLLSMIGISAYLPQNPQQERLTSQQITSLWKTTTIPELDTFAQRLGKPIILSEIGYRETADALYHTWSSTSNAAVDQQEQMEACRIALINVYADKHIDGMFFWGWSDVDQFSLVNTQAAGVIHSYYQSWQVPQM